MTTYEQVLGDIEKEKLPFIGRNIQHIPAHGGAIILWMEDRIKDTVEDNIVY